MADDQSLSRLLALEEHDADFFFGRDEDAATILTAIANRPGKFIALIGNSGVGKSSLVQAGVISALKRQHMPGGNGQWPERLHDSRSWAYLTMKPGDNPIRALASAFTRLWFEDATDPLRGERTDGWEKRLSGRGRLSELVEATQERFKDFNIEPPRRVFLYIDQGEELYARGTSQTIRRFSELLADGLADKRLIVMGSQRSDYYGRLQDNEVLFPVTERVNVPPLGAEALKTVLREPASVLGARLEPDNLVEFLVNSTLGPQAEADTETDDAAENNEISASAVLPLLADFMTDLWTRMRERDAADGVLRLADTAEVVPVGAALARRAEGFLAEHDEAAVRRLFTLKLALVQEEGEPVRRRVRTREDKCSDAEWALVEELADADWRLVVTGEEEGEPTAEIAHEVLLREWPTLKRWLADRHDFLVWKGQIERERKEHQTAGAFLQGLSLTRSESWFNTQSRDDIGEDNWQFIEASIDAKERIAREEDDRRRKELATAQELASQKEEAARLQKRLSVVMGVAVVVLTGLVWFSNDRMQVAENAENRAVKQLRQMQIEQARFRAGKALDLAKSGNHGNAVALAVYAMPQSHPEGWPDIAEIPEAPRALSTGLLGLKELLVVRHHENEIYSAAFSPDGARIVTGSEDNTARIWDAATGAEITVLHGHEGYVYSATFSPDGARIVTGSDDKTARIWKTWPTYDDLYRAGAEAVERLQPLTPEEECEYYLRAEGCAR